jgi:NAD(P)-dependent dehydrogenase (short-subunit alcohol dehydrogenase family)
VLVTGGASGIGQATAARFLEEGSRVCVLDRSDEARARVVKELPELAAAIDADVAALDQVQAAFAEAIDRMGSVDILINNAGISIRHATMRASVFAMIFWTSLPKNGIRSWTSILRVSFTWRRPRHVTWWTRGRV